MTHTIHLVLHIQNNLRMAAQVQSFSMYQSFAKEALF